MAASDSVLVIGGGGFIGKPLVSLLRESGCRVKVASRQASGRDEPGLEFRRADVGNPDSIRSAVEGASVVYYLATGSCQSWAEAHRDFVEGAANVAGACQANGVRRMIYVSSSAALYLGGAAGTDETAGTDPQPGGRGFYARGKIEAERMLLELHARSGLPVVIVRPAIVVGRGSSHCHSGVGQWPADTCCLGWGRGKHPLPFVLVEDAARALAAAKDVPGIEGQCFNLAGDVRLSAKEFLSLLRERSLRNFRFYPQSLWKMQAIEILKWGLKVAARKPDNPWPSFRDLKSRSMRAPMDCALAKRVLGWKPTQSLEVFLGEAIDGNLSRIPPGDLRRAASSGPAFQ
jgi:nucleoside-diphosphate-sugar epimerase